MKLFRLGVFVSFALLVLVSCDRSRFFEQNQAIEDELWSAKEVKTYTFDITDTNSLFSFYINVRNTNEYPYANLYVFVESKFPDNQLARDTIELQLARLNGQWLGSGQGKYKYNQFILRKGMRFVQAGSYTFSIEHGMRKDSLNGIADIGIRLEYDH